MMLAGSDCELIRSGWLGQPVNAVTSLGFLVVGALLIRSRPMIGWPAAAVGIGSFLYHGPMPGWAESAHDWSLAWLLAAIVLEHRPAWVVAAGVVLGGMALAFPVGFDAVMIGVAVLALASVICSVGIANLRLWSAAAFAAGAGGVINALSRSGGPLCSPQSVFQGHAAWHLAMAAALWLWARATRRREAPGRSVWNLRARQTRPPRRRRSHCRAGRI